jgi:GntR family mannosyl-D-glycerate transport/metabolism transcriptional repressor
VRSTPWGTYARIAEQLRERLADVAPGSALPSETSLAAEFGVVRNTVRRALAELQCEGLIVTLPGRGRVARAPAGATAAGYRRIADDLRQQITSGDLATGQRVPSEAELMRRYGVSRGTARQGLALLEATGLVRAVHGRGRFVDVQGRRSLG